MNAFFDRKKIVTVLFAIAFLLLILNVIVPTVFKFSRNKIVLKEIYSEEINSKFLSAVQGFGLKDDWIKTKKINNNDDDSLKYYYTINVPVDLPIALIITDINNSFSRGDVDYSSKETRSKESKLKDSRLNRITTLTLRSGGFEKLKAEFVYNPANQRTTGSIGFLVFGFSTLDTIRQYELINSPENFLAILMPSKDALEKIKKLKARDKDYGILLSDDISDLDYKLSQKYSSERLTLSVRSVLGDFPKAAAFFYDSKSSFVSHSVFPLIKKEFDKRNVRFLDINKFALLEEAGASSDISFERIINKADENKTELIYISDESYYKLKPEIFKYRKTGYKFINPYTAVTSFPR